MPLLHALDRLALWHIYAVAFVYGLLMMIALAGGPTIVPSLVEPTMLSTANALEMLSFTLGGVVGPALAGVLIGWIDAPTVVAVDAASYGLFALALLTIRPMKDDRPGPERSSAGSGLGHAVRLLLGNPMLLATTLMYLAFNIGGGVLALLLPVLTDLRFHGDARLYGVLVSALAVGEVVSALVVGALVSAGRLGLLICGAQALSGASLLLLLDGSQIVTVVIGLALFGGFSAPLTIWAQTLRMRIIPAHLRGRTFALLRTMMQSGNPIGSAVAGFILPALGIGGMIVLAVMVIAAPGLLGLRVAQLRQARG